MRHAFLITAYNNFDNLNRLLELLDDTRNVIFLHIDSKAETPAGIRETTKAKLIRVPSMNIRWGHVSQIECTLHLLCCALQQDWDYCHCITESDMPLKTMDEMDQIFTNAKDLEFVDFAPGNYEFARYKCDVYHLFAGFNTYRTSKLLKCLNHSLAKLQWHLGIRRNRKDYRHGSAYFSITQAFARYLCARRDDVLREYRYTIGADEVWLQTLCAASPFITKVANFEEEHTGNLRYIDWSRRVGNSPHTFTVEDLDDLISKVNDTPLCFARKFSADSPAAKKLAEYLDTRRNLP